MPAGKGNTKAISEQVSKVSFQLSFQVCSLLGQSEGERKASFGGCKKEGNIVRLVSRTVGCHKRWKVSPFFEIWNHLITPFLFLEPLTNKHIKTWSSMINLWVGCRTCQKQRTLLLARQKSKNYLNLSKENDLGDMILSHWPCFTWKLLIIWFHKNLKLIFQKPRSSPRNKCIEYWRELWKFSYTLRTTIMHNMCKTFCLLCYSSISKLKQSFHTACDQYSRFEILFWFSSTILFSKVKSLSFSLWKIAKVLIPFLKAQVIFLQILHQSSVLSNITPLYFFS